MLPALGAKGCAVCQSSTLCGPLTHLLGPPLSALSRPVALWIVAPPRTQRRAQFYARPACKTPKTPTRRPAVGPRCSAPCHAPLCRHLRYFRSGFRPGPYPNARCHRLVFILWAILCIGCADYATLWLCAHPNTPSHRHAPAHSPQRTGRGTNAHG